jgi:hypothetical protein
MTDNRLHEDIGYIKATMQAVASDVAEIKTDMKEKYDPVVATYHRDRNFIIGACAALSAVVGALFGGVGKAIARALHG